MAGARRGLFVVRPPTDDTTERAFDTAGRVLDEIEQELGRDAELLDLTVSAQGGGNVKYRTGDRAAGFQ
jgi:hypothetical protein